MEGVGGQQDRERDSIQREDETRKETERVRRKGEGDTNDDSHFLL